MDREEAVQQIMEVLNSRLPGFMGAAPIAKAIYDRLYGDIVCDVCGNHTLEPTNNPNDGAPLCPTCALNVWFTMNKAPG